MKLDTCLIITLVIAAATSLIISEDSRNIGSDSLVECLEKLDIPESTLGNLIIYANTSHAGNFIPALTSPHVMLNIRNEVTDVQQMIWKYSFYIVIVENSSDFQMLFDKILYSPSLDPRGKFLLILISSDDPDEYVQIAWKKNVVNICVIQFDTVENKTKVYSYFPYADGKCGSTDSRVLGNCDELNLDKMYINKVPKVFNGCPVRVNFFILEPAVMNTNSTVEDAKELGYEGLLFRIILQRMNLTEIPIVNNDSYGFKNPNGSYTLGTFNDLMNDIADVGYSRMFVNFSNYWDFDMSHVYFHERYAWHVPKAGPGAQWKNLILVFEKTLWFLLIGMLVINIVVWWIFAKACKIEIGLVECALYSWYTLLMGSVSSVLLSRLKSLVISWTIFALLITTAYQSQFLTILMKPIYEDQVSNEEEILAARLDIIMLHEPYTIIQACLPLDEEIYKRTKVIEFYALHELRMTFPSKLVTIQSEIRTKYLASKFYIGPDGKVKIYIFKHTFYNNPIVMYLQKGHPFTERFNEIILRVLSNGMFHKWLKDIDRTFKPVENLESSAITMNHLIGAFFSLLIGISISSVVFIWEIVIFKVKLNVTC